MWKHLSIILCLGLVVTARRVEQGDLEPYEEDVRAIRLTEESENIGQLSEREQELESLENKMEMLGGRVDQATGEHSQGQRSSCFLFKERDICSLPQGTPCENTDPRPNWYYDSDVGVYKEVPEGRG